MLISKNAWFRIVMVPMVLALGALNHYASLSQSELMVGLGLCSAVAARLTYTSLLAWKTLLWTIGGALVGMLVFQSWPHGRLFAELMLWWGVFGIPLRATLRTDDEMLR